jgi:phenylpropionate dioxygenase-like ring-hydroxylating dioxygenase large terminal subunit
MVCLRSRAYDVACNWKLFIEIFMEYYHLKAAHPDTLHTVNYHIPKPPAEMEGKFVSQFGTHQGTSAVLEGSGRGRFDYLPLTRYIPNH